MDSAGGTLDPIRPQLTTGQAIVGEEHVMENNAHSFVEYFEKIRLRTNRVVACIPAEELEWTYKLDVGVFLPNLQPRD